MKLRWVFALLLISRLAARGQEDTITLQDLVEGAQQWAQENLDTNVLNALQDVDEQKAQQFFTNLQHQFQGEYVVDLAPLKDSAPAIVSLLESHEETHPYAVWLKTRLDYLEVADQLRLIIPPPTVKPGEPPKRAPNPAPARERAIWVKKIATRPWPAAAKDYVPQLKPVFARQQVPPQLVWIAEVESSFDPRARSPAGAAGLFQLMPATAKQYGLSLWPRDQRLQPRPSARASADYLKSLYDRFKDWRLALAAYNAGEGTVQKLLDRYKTRSFDQIAPHLPAETQMYVPKIEAILLRREGVKLANLPAPEG